MDRHNLELAMVVDEYGAVTGLLSREDIVEEVIGDITDRRDETSLFTRSSHNVIIASGKLELDIFSEIFDIPLHSPSGMVTIGGWLTEQMGDIPKAGQYYQTKEFLFHVLAADPHRIRRLYIRRLEHSSRGKKDE
jgi:CBS domain containing-hemolysin-like protein